MTPSPSTLGRRLQALLASTPDGLTSPEIARALGCSVATAAATCGRLFWAGAIDRLDLCGAGSRYRYRCRAAHASQPASVED